MIQRRILIAMSPARGRAKEGPPEDHVAEDGGEENEADGKDLERHWNKGPADVEGLRCALYATPRKTVTKHMRIYI